MATVVLEAENGGFDLGKLPPHNLDLPSPPARRPPRKVPAEESPRAAPPAIAPAPIVAEEDEDDDWVKVNAWDAAPGEVAAARYKDSGNARFRAGRYKAAIADYGAALDAAPGDATALRAVVLANRAAAHSKLKDDAAVVADCGACLVIDAKYTKALVRRATALANLGKPKEAAADLVAALALEPELTRVKEALKRLQKADKAE